jgi:PAS domain S-box-containing protein
MRSGPRYGSPSPATRDAERLLADALRRLRFHSENSPLAVVEWDARFRIVAWNAAAERMFGWSAAEVLGKGMDELRLVHPEDAASVRDVSADMVTRARPSNVNANRNVRKDGSVIDCEWYNSALHDDSGQLVSVLSLVLDVTARREAERRAEELARFPGENPDPVMRLCGELTVLYANAAARGLLARLGGEVGRLAPAGLAEPARRALRERTRIRTELAAGDGVFSVSVVPVGSEVNLYAAEITGRKRAEEALRESEARFRAMADAAPVLIWMAGTDKLATWFNRGWLEFTGRPLEQELGEGWAEGVHPGDRQRCLDTYAAHFDRREAFTMDYRLRRADGEWRWLLDRGTPRTDEHGAFLGYIGSCVDIHERKVSEEALRAANERLADADRHKSDFLAILSHELRNPLAPIRNAAHLLERAAPGSPEAVRAVEIVKRQAAHLAALVDDLLDLNRIDRGKITLRRERLDAREVARRAAEDHGPIFAERGVALRLHLVPEPAWVDADAARLAQIVNNLVDNAAKFTPRDGTVTVAVARVDGSCELRVRDTGVGIERDVLERIFEPFEQADRTRGRARGGIGIGLALVKSLVELHGGTVRASSEGPGKGAELVVSLPLAPAASTPEPARPSASVPGLSILVVEDNRDAGETLAELLRLQGHRARLAPDGASGLAAFHEAIPDVLLCDVGLPDQTGYDVVRKVRALPGGRGAYLVALTGYAQPEDAARAREAGFDAHVPKPLAIEDLDALLARAARNRG